ncbi:GGDEF domain-containing protein [Rhizobium sp. ARZ01]|uniref:sensor domain-containing diguanylate cyclase n=1 Tax=Rhizobium sp. ARZ01 TaxID=2769313 RepID=UPI00178737DF|nr:sensor domain-containing diguanylate cyclase [Rhizobium sp. ARZ01]MBD9371146.1 GGDEF domain-containing protein [Rhizobium sp. ARZ01]
MISDSVVDVALRELFDLSPVPFSISTTEHHSRYIKVNPAYLRLIGRTWDEINGQPLTDDLPYSSDDPARLHRMNLLDTQGFYELAEVEMRHVSGRIIPTLISAQRRRIDGESFDIEIILDNSERKAFERAILDAAFTDAMTGLQNRASFESYLRRALTEANADSRIVLAYIDLNRFKKINDEHGHSVGDKLLRAIAKRLVEWSAHNDFVARLGGDEFAIVSSTAATEEFSLARFFDLGQRIAKNIVMDESILRVGAAIGVTEASPGVSFDALLDGADKLMYAAKATGKLVDVCSSARLHKRTGRILTNHASCSAF